MLEIFISIIKHLYLRWHVRVVKMIKIQLFKIIIASLIVYYMRAINKSDEVYLKIFAACLNKFFLWKKIDILVQRVGTF